MAKGKLDKGDQNVCVCVCVFGLLPLQPLALSHKKIDKSFLHFFLNVSQSRAWLCVCWLNDSGTRLMCWLGGDGGDSEVVVAVVVVVLASASGIDWYFNLLPSLLSPPPLHLFPTSLYLPRIYIRSSTYEIFPPRQLQLPYN